MEQRLAWLKAALGIEDTARDELLTFILETVVGQILAYIRHDTLPEDLERPAVLMAVSYWKGGGLGNEQATPGAVTALSMGDVTTSFADPGGGILGLGGADSFFGWRTVLDGYRRLKPSGGR